MKNVSNTLECRPTFLITTGTIKVLRLANMHKLMEKKRNIFLLHKFVEIFGIFFSEI
jgi:hypothetical protein